MPTDGRAAKKPKTELTARERFLQELTRFASDEDDENVAAQNGGVPATAPAPQSSAASFFAHEDDEGELHAPHPGTAADGSFKQVGLSLLREMHESFTEEDDTAPRSMKKVETYVPLSSGGFLDTDAEHGDLRNVKVGDILVSLKRAADSASSSKLASPSTASPVPETGYSSPTSTAPTEHPATVIAAAANRTLLSHFRAEASMTEEEKLYGKKPTTDMLQQLLAVARLDKATNTIEGVFLDGSRTKLRLFEVRPAGFVEKALYQKWKADPASRPVRVIGGGSAESAQGSKTALASTSVGVQSSGNCVALTASPVPPMEWWVLPNLLVRVVAADAAEWYGEKCVVVAVRKKESTVRLMKADVWAAQQQQLQKSRQTTVAQNVHANIIEVCGLAALETVLPKKGETGIVVLGGRKGDMVAVLARLRGEDGELRSVEVRCARTHDIFHLQPHELCALARR